MFCVVVKGIYVSWSNDPPNTKIKDWNVTELKVGFAFLFNIILVIFCVLSYFTDRSNPPSCR